MGRAAEDKERSKLRLRLSKIQLLLPSNSCCGCRSKRVRFAKRSSDGVQILGFTKGNLLYRNLQSPWSPEHLHLSPEGNVPEFLDFPKRENLSGPYERPLSSAVVLICAAAVCLCLTKRRLKGSDKSFRLDFGVIPKGMTTDSVSFSDFPVWSESLTAQIWLSLLGHQALRCMIIKGGGREECRRKHVCIPDLQRQTWFWHD